MELSRQHQHTSNHAIDLTVLNEFDFNCDSRLYILPIGLQTETEADSEQPPQKKVSRPNISDTSKT